MANKYFQKAFAENGDRTVIENTTPDGEISYDAGYSSDYEIDKDVDPAGARDVELRQFNQLMNDITGNLKTWQEFRFPEWIADSDGAGTPYSYPIGYVVVRDGVLYQSDSNDNTSDPLVSGWSEFRSVPSNNIAFTFDTVSAAVSSGDALKEGDILETRAYRFNVAGESGYGGAKYVVRNISDFGAPNEISDHTIAGTSLCLVLIGREEAIWLEQYGAYNDGTQWAGISTAFEDSKTYKSPIMFGAGTFDTPTTLNYYGYGIEGRGGVDNSFLGSTTLTGSIIKKADSQDRGEINTFTLFGAGAGAGQFGFGHDGNNTGWFQTIINRVKFQSLQACAQVQFSLGCQFNNVYARDCGNGFYFEGPRAPGSPGWNQSSGVDAWYNNIITFTSPVFVNCSGTAIDFEGANLNVINPWFQGGGRGLVVNGGSCPSLANFCSTPYSEQMDISVIEVRDFAELTISGGGTFLCNIGGGSAGATDDVIIVDNGSRLFENGSLAFIDVPSNSRRTVSNNSQIIALSEYNNSVANLVDATSKYYSISTFIEDYNYPEETVVTNPAAGTPYSLNSGIRMTDGAWEIYITTPEGKKTSLTMYGELTGSSWAASVVGGPGVNYVGPNQFTVDLGGASVLTFDITPAVGTVTVTSTGSTAGDLSVKYRRILEKQRQPAS